jgi:hypothetical protein
MARQADFAVIDVSGLTDEEVSLLHQDVQHVADEDGEGAWTFNEAERVLLTRIGGQRNVKDYVACLMVGKKRREDREKG